MKATARNTRTVSSWNLLPEESFHLVSGDDALWMPLGSPGWDTSAKDVGWKQFYIEWVRKAVQIRRTASVSYEGYLSFAPLPPPKRLAWDEDPSLRQYDFIGKILVVGAASVGKSSFSNFFEPDQAHRNQWRRKQVLRRIGDFNLQFELWDDKDKQGDYIWQGTYGIIFMFSLCDPTSIIRLKHFVDLSKERKYQMPHFVPLLVGNKADLATSRKVTRETAEKFAEEHGMFYVEISTYKQEEVFAALDLLCSIILRGTDGALPLPIPPYVPTESLRQYATLVPQEAQPNRKEVTQEEYEKNKRCICQ